MNRFILRFIRGDEGQDIIEYALLGGFLSVVSIAAVTLVGLDVDRLFNLIDVAMG